MAVTAAVTLLNRNVTGNQRKHSGLITWAGTTTDNGDALTPATFGLHTLADLELEPAVDSTSNPENVFGTKYIKTSDVVGGKVTFYTAHGTPGAAVPFLVITDGTSVANYTSRFTAWGT
jgi:hypothetical protein